MVINNITERIGIHRVALCFLEKFGWLEREQSDADYGIDTQVEIVENNNPTGLLYCIQVKAGISYMKKSHDFITFYPEEKHVKYWLDHSLPVILIICDLEKNNNYWEFVNEETVKKTEKGWEIDISLDNILDNDDSIKKIKAYYFTNDNFTIMESGIDTSHALSRRIAMKIVLKKEVSKAIIEEQLPQLIEGLKKSDYYRSEIVGNHFKNTPADCVWIWFYKNFEQYKNGLPFCTAYWNHPKSKSPTILNSDDKEINGIFINWSKVEISDNSLKQRLTKGKYLKLIDNYLSTAESVFQNIHSIYQVYKENKPLHYLKEEVLKYRDIHDVLLTKDYNQNYPPLECNELDQCINNVYMSIENIFTILTDEKRNERNINQCMDMYIKMYLEDIGPAKYEREKVV